MRIVFLASAQRDLEWFRRYYEGIFPEGARHAADRYQHTIRTLQENPEIGRPFGDANLRILTVLRTPFIFVYRIGDDAIEILRVRDGRSGE